MGFEHTFQVTVAFVSNPHRFQRVFNHLLPFWIGCQYIMSRDDLNSFSSGKLHINYREEDVLIHCTDNPGRTTFLRTSVSQKVKANSALTFEEAYSACVDDVLRCCVVRGMGVIDMKERHIVDLYVKVVNKRTDGIALLNKAMKIVIEGGVHIFATDSPSSQPSSKTRRPNYDSGRRRYHKDSYSLESYKEVQSWRNRKQ